MMETKSWKTAGGINVVRDAVSRHRAPGELVGCMNYEAREEGYRRIDGYERFDGRKAPSNTLDDEPEMEAIETEKRRRLITRVPGDTLLAVWRYADTTYAFSRTEADEMLGTEAVTRMYHSSPDGWLPVDLGYRVEFTGGTGAAFEPGETISAAGVDATVIGFYLTGEGTWAGDDAAGVLVLSYAGSGRFAANATVTGGTGGGAVTLSAIPAEQTVGTGEEFRFVNHNFFGLDGRERMYGLSGQGRPFEFDGTMFLELYTGVPLATASPHRLAAHENFLWVGYPQGSITYSNIGNPRVFDAAVGGAGEITIGDRLTELLPGYRNTLFLFGRNSTKYAVGVPGADTDFAIRTLSDEAGAMDHTAQLIDQPMALDDRGIRNVTATEQFGDFSIGTISDPVRPILDEKREAGTLPVASMRSRRKSQYRVFFSDGDCIVLNYVRRRGLVAEYTRFSFDLHDEAGNSAVGIVRSVCSVEDSDGRERVFFVLKAQRLPAGSREVGIPDSNYVYEMDRGHSFDGHGIPYYLRLPYNDFKAPFAYKRYRKLLIEVDSAQDAHFGLAADFDDDRESSERGLEHEVLGPSAFWSESFWSKFYWNEVSIRKAEQRIAGRGRNISILLRSITKVPPGGRFPKTRVEQPHVITGVTVYYDARRMLR